MVVSTGVIAFVVIGLGLLMLIGAIVYFVVKSRSR